MFTGIVEEKGRVLLFKKQSRAWLLQVETNAVGDDVALGDSIAVNGCCLTVAGFTDQSLSFDVLEITRSLTNFASVREGCHVNLERSMRFNGKMGGHFVTGHIDGLGKVKSFEQRGADYYMQVQGPTGCGRYIVHKGSISMDGISLTVAEVDADGFAVWLIPTTMEVTNLSEKKVGDGLNLEFDMIGKYVEKLTRAQLS